MVNNLHIIDISPHIYAGSVNKKVMFEGPLESTPDGWVQNSIPAGGISFLFNTISKYAGTATMVFCADRSPINRLKILDTYKSGRNTPDDVAIQKTLIETILEHCRLHLMYMDDYEADDLIYTLVKDNKDKYDHIYVHTGDSDMYSLVDNNVSILPSSSRAKEVTLENYSYTVNKDRHVPYNTLNFIKMLEGDSTDKIPPVKDGSAKTVYDMLENRFVQEYLGDPEFVEEQAKAIGGDLYRNFLLVYPWYVPGLEIDTMKNPDIMKIKAWGKVLGNANYKHQKVDVTEVKQMVDSFFKGGE